jgi:radical SAM/Cys-rich protein
MNTLVQITQRLAGLNLADDAAGPKRVAQSIRARRSPLEAPEAQLAALAQAAPEADFHATVAGALTPLPLEVFQINLGKLCNMTCRHCHVDAGPDRTDAVMDRETAEACLAALDQTDAHTVDLTGGAPELNPHFEWLVDQAIARGKHVIDRCNLTILTTRRFAHLPQWFADRGVEVVASLPHWRARNTDAQRGDGTYARSIEALRTLNAVGYGQGDPKKTLTLMANPAGAFLAPNQCEVEAEWRAGLLREHGVHFDRLFCLNNMPISRYLEWLLERGQLEAYMTRLSNAYNPGTVGGLMCRNTLSVSWDGRLYDCDFNQMLELDAALAEPHVAHFDPALWQARRIVTERHCFGCTAGSGSSCAGATA